MALLERSWGPLGRSRGPPSAHLVALGPPNGVHLAILTPKFSLVSQLSIRFGPKSLSKLKFSRFGIDVGPPRTLRIELPCRRELNFHVSPLWAFNGAFWLNLYSLGRFLGSTWSLLGASWAQLGVSWPPLGLNLAALGLNLDALGPSKPHSKRNLVPLGRNLEDFKGNLAPLRSIFGALATLRVELSPARELDFRVLVT